VERHFGDDAEVAAFILASNLAPPSSRRPPAPRPRREARQRPRPHHAGGREGRRGLAADREPSSGRATPRRFK
jgi:hypothetical protein